MKYEYPEKFHPLLRSLELQFDPFGEISEDECGELIEAVENEFSEICRKYHLQMHRISGCRVCCAASERG